MINVVGANENPDQISTATEHKTYAVALSKNPHQPIEAVPAASAPTTPAAKPIVQQAIAAAIPGISKSPIAAPPAPITPAAPLSAPSAPEIIPPSAPTQIQPGAHVGPSKSFQWWLLAGVLFLLTVGGGAALWLTQSNQDIRQQASGTATSQPSQTSQTEALNQAAVPTQIPLATLAPTRQLALAVTTSPTATPTEEPLPTVTTTPTNTPTPEPTGELLSTTLYCGESCISDDNCRNTTHQCYQGICRLTSNPTNTSCLLVSGGNQVATDAAATDRIYTPNASPSGEALQAGPTNWLIYGWMGVATLAVGGLALLWLRDVEPSSV